MPKLNADLYDNLPTDGNGGGGHSIDPGGYVLIIQKVELNDRKPENAVDIVFDVAEGEAAGTFSDEWSAQHTFAHRITMDFAADESWKVREFNTFMGVVDAANPGFNARAAFEADQFVMFTGKKFGAVIHGREKVSDTGYTNINVDQYKHSIVPVDAVRNGEVRVKAKVTPDGGKWADAIEWDAYNDRDNGAQSAQTASYGAAAYDTAEVPF